MAALSVAGSGSGLIQRYGCDSFRGVYMIPMQVSPPRRVVVAEAQRSGRTKTTKSNAVGSSNAGPRVSSADVMREESREEEEEKKKKAAEVVPLQQRLMATLKLDKAMDEVVGFMAPREKGDIRDVILMSLSFAVLVYISQRLVCLYCVVRHMASQQF